MLTLAVLLLVIVLACVGSVELSKLNINININVFGPFAPPPVATQTAIPSVSPTTSAHK